MYAHWYLGCPKGGIYVGKERRLTKRPIPAEGRKHSRRTEGSVLASSRRQVKGKGCFIGLVATPEGKLS